MELQNFTTTPLNSKFSFDTCGVPRILRIINRFNLGGPTYNASYLTRHLADRYETMLVGGPPEAGESDSLFIPESLGLDVRILNNVRRNVHPLRDRKGYRELRQLIREFKPDIVHTHASKAGALGRLAAAHENVPVVVHTFHGHVFRNYFGPSKTKAYINVERYLAKRTDGLIAISKSQHEDLTQVFRIAPASKVNVIPLGFDLNRFQTDMNAKRTAWRAQHGIEEHVKCVGIIGRLAPIKNHEAFLRIAAMDRRDDVRFYIIGDGSERNKLEDLARELDLLGTHPKVFFTSWEFEIDKALAGLDVIALTSLNEGTPVSLIEAMAASKPVISMKAGGVADIVQDGESGVLLEQGDLNGFSSQLDLLLNDAALCGGLAARGRERALARHGLQRLIHKTDEYYQLLLSRKGI